MVRIAIFVYKTLYFLVHYVYTVLELFANLQSKLFGHEFKREDFIHVGKVPRHLTVLLGHEQPSFFDLTNLILWSMAAGISFISFYDYKGTLRKQEDRFRNVVDKKKQPCDHIIWHNAESTPLNGFKGNKIHIKILDNDDGRRGLIELCRKFVNDSETDFSVNNIDRVLNKRYEFPDPDLGICCGKTFSLFGYPPWQVRVTEFLTISSHHNVKFNVFLDILERYSKCEQRFGK